MKSCASCRYWEPTEIDVVVPAARTETVIALQRESSWAIAALCAWPAVHPVAKAFIGASPSWIRRLAGGGVLTDEHDGSDCPCWMQRDDIEIGRGC